MAYPRHVQALIERLRELPGIGPRQAVRLAFAVLEKGSSFAHDLAQTAIGAADETVFCGLCFRSMEKPSTDETRCQICRSAGRDREKIMVVEKESDVEAFESADNYQGLYHVLGGSISAFEKNPGEKLHLRELFDRLKNEPARAGYEVIIATANTLEGNQTANYIERILEPLKVRVTRLGRGLSTGAEIEYADPLTLEQALKNRK